MNKEEFLSELQECLTDEVSPREINDSMNYYRNYISEQLAAGKKEEEIMTELGSARLIARSIIDASGEGDLSGGAAYEAEEITYDENNERVDTEKEELKEKAGAMIRRILTTAVFVILAALLIRISITLLPFVFILILIFWIFR